MRNSSTTRFLLLALGVTLGILLLGSAILVADGFRDHLGRADIALVLGSKVELDGTPSRSLRARLDRTLELYRAGYFPAVIASGGVGKEGYDEALVMRNYLASHGIPQERIIMDNTGTTTFASARNTFQTMRKQKLGSVLVVSQYFHIPRARMALKRFGISEVYSSHAHLFEPRDIYSVPRELLGYLFYSCRHYDAGSESNPQ